MSVTGTNISLTLRNVKGSELTYSELDGNQSNLKTGIENHSHDEFAPVLGADDNYVTDAEKTKLANLSGVNSGDQDLSGYSLTSHNHNLNDLTEKSYNSLTDKPTIPSVSGLLDETAHDLLDHTGLTGIPTQYTDEMAQDAIGAAITAGSQTGITVTYDNANNKIDFTVTTSDAGDVTGPDSAINNNIAVFDGITGKIIKDSGSSLASFEAAGAVSGHVSTYDHSKLHDAVTVSGNGISVVGQQVSLSIGTGATQIAQGDHSHTGVYEPADPTILKDADIGVTVQAYGPDLTSWASIATSAKQDTLVSGTNIKTINTLSLLGAGDISIPVLTDGDKGDVVVSGSGSNWTVESVAGNLAFLGTGARIRGDFSNATIANRAMFQTSTANAASAVGAIPNGTGNSSSFVALNTSDSNNAGYLSVLANNTTTALISAAIGTGSYLPMTFYTGGAQRLNLATDGTFTSVSGAIGYGTGAGGTVTQATSKATSVTLNKPCGQITMNNAALAAGATVWFNVISSVFAANDLVVVNTLNGNYSTLTANNASGYFSIGIKNETAGSLSEAVVINFAIIKGAIS